MTRDANGRAHALHSSNDDEGVLCRSALAVGARNQREHERIDSRLFPEGDRLFPDQPTQNQRGSEAVERAATESVELGYSG